MSAGWLDTPVGPLTVTVEAGCVTEVSWDRREDGDDPVLNDALDQLAAYFNGRLITFTLPLALGEGFRERFLAALCAIPYGETRSYGDLAQELGVSAQAIGQACGANPIPVIVPCHRVLGANGLGGFSGAGGVETKVALLRHEGAASLLI